MARVGQVVLGALVVAVAAILLVRQLHGLRLHDLAAALDAIPAWRIAACLGLTALSFACLAQYEAWATRWAAPGRVPAPVARRVGLLAHALANTLGFHALTAGAVRWRAYAAQGLTLPDVARVVALVGACVATGAIVLGLVALAGLRLAGMAGAVAAGALLALAAGWSALHGHRARRADAASWTRTAWAHLPQLALVGVVEMLAATGALFVLLPPGTIAPAAYVLLFLGAMLAGIASHAPGGLGVFEAAMLAGLSRAPVGPVLAALLAYRAIYNLLPFGLAVLALARRGWRRRGLQFERGYRAIRRRCRKNSRASAATPTGA